MNLILNILRTIPLFATLTESEHKSIIDHIQMQYFPAHYSLFKAGDMGGDMYIIKSGMVRIFNEGQDLATLGEGDFFGEMALIDQMPRMASAETLSDSEVFVLKREDFAELMQKSHETSKKVQEAYEARKKQNS